MSATRAQIRNSIARSARLTAAIARTPVLCAQFSHRFAASEVWNLLFPKGTWHGENLKPIGGSITIDDAMLEEMVANWRGAGGPPLPVYKTHAHLEEDVSALERAELSKAYGYLTDFRVTAEGLEAKTEWTPAGKAMVDAGEFAFWSPEWQPKHRDRRTGDIKGWWLSGTALCSNPFFHEMPPVAASADDAETTDPTTPNKDTSMTPEQKKRMKAALKCAETCTDDELVAAAEKYGSMTATAEDVSATITAAVKSQVEPVQAQLTAAQAETAKLKASLLDRDVDGLIATAKRGDGKTGRAITEPLVAVARDLAHSKGLQASKDFLEALPLSVPLAAQGVSGSTDVVLTQDGAQKKLQARAEELRAKGVKEPYLAALTEMPDVALIAEGRSTSTTVKAS